MKKIQRLKDSWGDIYINVGECDKYKYEDPEVPKKPILDLHNEEIDKIYDIIDVVENYFENSGK